MLEGLRGEESIAELCRRQGIASSMYYGWSKEFLEAGKKRLAGDTARAATSDEVKDLRRESQALKEVVADLTLENRLLKKSMSSIVSSAWLLIRPETMRSSTSVSHACGLTPFSLALAMRLAAIAQCLAPASEPANRLFFLPRAMARIARSTTLVSSSMQPSARNRLSPSQWRSA